MFGLVHACAISELQTCNLNTVLYYIYKTGTTYNNNFAKKKTCMQKQVEHISSLLQEPLG